MRAAPHVQILVGLQGHLGLCGGSLLGGSLQPVRAAFLAKGQCLRHVQCQACKPALCKDKQ